MKAQRQARRPKAMARLVELGRAPRRYKRHADETDALLARCQRIVMQIDAPAALELAADIEELLDPRSDREWLLTLERRRRGRQRTDEQRSFDAFIAQTVEDSVERLHKKGFRSPVKQALNVMASASSLPVKTIEAAIARAKREARAAAEQVIKKAALRK